jgi:hypothetical protein
MSILRTCSRLSTLQTAATFAKEHSLIFLEVSAKFGENVAEVFQEIGVWCGVVSRFHVHAPKARNVKPVEQRRAPDTSAATPVRVSEAPTKSSGGGCC